MRYDSAIITEASVTLTLTLLVLFAAALHATWNAFVKAGEDPLATQMTIFGVAGLWALPLLLVVPLPNAEGWWLLMLSTLVHIVYFVALALGYRNGDLSLVYPIARGSAPMLVALLAAVFAAETSGTGELAGIVLISLGIFSLALIRDGAKLSHGRAVLYALFTGAAIAGYTTIDGLGVRATPQPSTYIAWLFVMQGLTFTAVTVLWRGPKIWYAVKADWQRGTLGGTIAVISYSIIIWSMSVAPIAPVSALRETSVVMAALLGALFLREPFGRRRIIASAIVVAGAVVLALWK